MRGIRALLAVVVCGVTLGTAPVAAQAVQQESPRAEARRHWHHGERHEWRRHHQHRRHFRQHHRPYHGNRRRGEI